MPLIDFRKIDEPKEYPLLPPGKYEAEISSIQEASTQYGDEMWKLDWVILTGPHRGAFVSDNLTFNEKGVVRVKRLCSAVGLDVSGEMNLRSLDLNRKRCLIEVKTTNFTDRNGEQKEATKVTFAGFFPLDSTPKPLPPSEESDSTLSDETPF